jgi:RNA polymerase-interacting CarD/CdnL/TRCF family regulator
MTYQIGDKVIHSTQGFGEIINIESKEVAGVTADYYVVKTKDLLLWIPIASSNKESLRLPTSKNRFSALMDILRSHNLPLSNNRNERKSQIHDRLSDGATESMCGLIRDLSYCRKNQKLNDTETSIFKRAVSKLIDEWQYAMSIPPSQALGELNVLLDESFTVSSRNN